MREPFRRRVHAQQEGVPLERADLEISKESSPGSAGRNPGLGMITEFDEWSIIDFGEFSH